MDKKFLKNLARWLSKYSIEELSTLLGTLSICYKVDLKETEQFIEEIIKSPLSYKQEIMYMAKVYPPRKGSILEKLKERVINEELKTIE